MIAKPFKFCICCVHCVYNNEWLIVHNVLITHGVLKMVSNVCREVNEVREERLRRKRECNNLAEREKTKKVCKPLPSP